LYPFLSREYFIYNTPIFEGETIASHLGGA
jgi:hypothetical protein